jgi:hypothetical protein
MKNKIERLDRQTFVFEQEVRRRREKKQVTTQAARPSDKPYKRDHRLWPFLFGGRPSPESQSEYKV